jgi:pilus assembly protein CpaF
MTTLTRHAEESPLAQVERAVQERAKAVALDMNGPDGVARLRQLVADEVARWTNEYKHGRRDYDLADPDALAERAWRNLTGYGPLAPLLDDDDVWEIMVNAPDLLFPGQRMAVPPPPAPP